jgi:hypothetical protein
MGNCELEMENCEIFAKGVRPLSPCGRGRLSTRAEARER